MELVSKAISYILKNDTGLTDIISSGNIWHGRIPQGTTSARIRFYMADIVPNGVKGINGQASIDEQTVAIEVYGADDEVVSLAAQQIRNNLDRYPHGTYDGIILQGVEFVGAGFNPDEADRIDAVRFMLEFKIRVGRTPLR
jgi:hypothetical protein